MDVVTLDYSDENFDMNKLRSQLPAACPDCDEANWDFLWLPCPHNHLHCFVCGYTLKENDLWSDIIQ